MTGWGAIAAAYLLSGCSPNQQPLSCTLPAASTEAVARIKQTPSIQLSLFLDGTPSMQGYINGLPDSQYGKPSASSTALLLQAGIAPPQNTIGLAPKSSPLIATPFSKRSSLPFIKVEPTSAPAVLTQL